MPRVKIPKDFFEVDQVCFFKTLLKPLSFCNICSYTAILIFFISSTLNAQIPELKNTPESDIEQGNAIIEATLCFRKDIDVLDHKKINPALFTKWIISAPPYVLRDIIRFGKAPGVVYEAANRLMQLQKGSTQLLKEIASRYKNTGVYNKFAGLRVKYGDKKYIEILLNKLNAQGDTIKLHAAAILAHGDKIEGFELLKKYIRSCDINSDMAALVLGETGKKNDVNFLRAQIDNGCSRNSFLAAWGERLFKTQFPVLYQVMLRRDSMGTRYSAPKGLYSVWMTAFGEAYKKNVKTGWELIKFLQGFKDFEHIWPGRDKVLIRRDLDSFIAFLKVANAISSYDSKVPWPVDFKSALTGLRHVKILKNDSSGKIFSIRVSAAISILNALQQKNELSANESSNIKYYTLTPSGQKVNDNNFGTAWHGMDNSKIVVVFNSFKKLKAIKIAAGCFNDKNTIPKKIEIDLKNKNATEHHTINSNPESFYYTTIVTKNSNVKKLVLTVKGKSAIPFCISEVKFIKAGSQSSHK